MKKYESIYQNIKGSIKRGGLKQLQTDDEVLSYLCKSLQDILQDLGEPYFQWYDNDWDDDQPEGSDTYNLCIGDKQNAVLKTVMMIMIIMMLMMIKMIFIILMSTVVIIMNNNDDGG